MRASPVRFVCSLARRGNGLFFLALPWTWTLDDQNQESEPGSLRAWGLGDLSPLPWPARFSLAQPWPARFSLAQPWPARFSLARPWPARFSLARPWPARFSL